MNRIKYPFFKYEMEIIQYKKKAKQPANLMTTSSKWTEDHNRNKIKIRKIVATQTPNWETIIVIHQIADVIQTDMSITTLEKKTNLITTGSITEQCWTHWS